MFTCESCGKTFELRQDVLDRYPGWVPKQCLDCRDRKTPPASRPKTAASVSKNRDLTIAEVLDTFTEGPDTGVFTDGASAGNPGPGGWGAVKVIDGEVVSEARGSEDHTTNNRMELMALIAGLKMVASDERIDVYTDSKLVVDTVNTWAAGWEKRGWTRKTGPIKNLELVKEAFHLSKERPAARVTWIAAHSGYRWNEYADSLATAYRRDRL